MLQMTQVLINLPNLANSVAPNFSLQSTKNSHSTIPHLSLGNFRSTIFICQICLSYHNIITFVYDILDLGHHRLRKGNIWISFKDDYFMVYYMVNFMNLL